MILMLRNFQFNALSRGIQRPNLPYKKALTRHIQRIQSTSVATRNSATLLLESSLLKIDISQQFIFYKNHFRTSCNITSSANKSSSYLHLIVSCCELEFQFLSFPTHSRLPSRSTCSAFYVPNPLSPLGCNTLSKHFEDTDDIFCRQFAKFLVFTQGLFIIYVVLFRFKYFVKMNNIYVEIWERNYCVQVLGLRSIW
jgi:hypothetical protein